MKTICRISSEIVRGSDKSSFVSMDVFVIDISGKVNNYDCSLCNSLCKLADVTLVTQLDGLDYSDKIINLIRLVPNKFKSSESIVKRLVKSVEVIINYILVLIYILKKSPTILHFQWFPFMEFCSLDNYYIKLIKILKPKQKIILTIHNVYPHNMTQRSKENYKGRFMKMDRYINHYIVHTESSMNEVVNEFGVISKRITVIPHGIFTPNYSFQKKCCPPGLNIIMYGNNSPYKGADILIDALQLLPESERTKWSVVIAGRTSIDYLTLLESKAKGVNVKFIPSFVPDQQLYEMIDEADYIALPYRAISQSGVLLLALYFNKPLLISNLPSFKETLSGFTEDMFFESENPQSLAELIMRYCNGKIDIGRQKEIISKLNEVYSWDESAKKTANVYDICSR